MDTLELNKSAHPGIILVDLVLKAAPIIVYIFFGLFISSSFQLYIVYVISALEFWWTKNVTGRILVGLYWELKVSEDGKEEFIYKIKRDEKLSNEVDRKLFWAFQTIISVFWSAMALKNIIFFQNPIGPLIPAGIALHNLIHFFKCSKQE